MTPARRVEIAILIIVVVAIASVPFILSVVPFNQLLSGSGGGPGNEESRELYNSFASLKGNSTIVALLTVTKLNSTYCDSPHTGCIAANFVFQANVTSYVKGSGPISIYVTDFTEAGDPLLVVGDQYVLFLTNNWNCAPSPPAPPCVLPQTQLSVTYHIVGGPQGKFDVRDNLVYGLKSLYPPLDDWIRVDAKGIPLDQFVKQVQNA